MVTFLVALTTSCEDVFQSKPCVTNNTGDLQIVDNEYPNLDDMSYEIEWSNGMVSSGTFISYNRGKQSESNNPVGYAYILYAWEVYDSQFIRWIVWGENYFIINQCQTSTIYCDAQNMFQGRTSELPYSNKVLASDYGDGTVLEIIKQLNNK